jgi:ubiquinol-cytochrome c reductase cytochrome c1 subunit
MTKFRSQLMNALASSLLLLPVLAAASEGAEMKSAQIDLTDKAALQHGAGLYMSYCSGCHSIGYHRYSRTAEDLGLTQEQVEKNLIYNDQKFGETINTGMNADDAKAWLGKAPPDLSVEARTKEQGADWIYNYLTAFYIDESRPSGWNNSVFPNASMPNVLWELQGVQHPLLEAKKKDADGVEETCAKGESQGQCVTGYTIPEAQAGKVSAEEFDRDARDISAFLAYVGEPAVLKRESMGVWVVLFLAFFTLLAYLLKAEYWRDVH